MSSTRRVGRLAEHVGAATARPVATAASGGYKVAAIGAGGGIGQPLSLLLKLSPKISHLTLYDVVRTKGVGADLGHIDSPATLEAFVGMEVENLKAALEGADLVVITAGIARKPGMTRDDLFGVNAKIMKGIIEAIADTCPGALINIISNPVNSLVPMAKEILVKKGVYDKNKLMGVTTLDLVRAQTFVSEKKGLDVTKTIVPVIGGHSGKTILPLLSQVEGAAFSDDEVEALTDRIQNAGTEVVEAKEGEGSATLSTAYSGYIFVEKCLDGLAGKPSVYDYTYIDDDGPDAIEGVPFFSRKVKFGPGGIAEICPTGPVSKYEADASAAMLDELKREITKGVDFAHAE